MGTGRAGTSFQHPLLTASSFPCPFNPVPSGDPWGWGTLCFPQRVLRGKRGGFEMHSHK